MQSNFKIIFRSYIDTLGLGFSLGLGLSLGGRSGQGDGEEGGGDDHEELHLDQGSCCCWLSLIEDLEDL